MNTWTILIENWLPPLLNRSRGRHWSVGHKLTQQAAERLGWAKLAAGVPDATTRRRVAVTLILGPQSKKCDGDSLKHFWDGCKHAHLIVDDSLEWLEAPPLAFERGPQKGTKIVIEDLAPLEEAT